MSKRFLNVKYNNIQVQIDTRNLEDISEVQKAVEEWYSTDIPQVTALKVQLWNKTAIPSIQFDDLDDIKALPEQYFWEPKKHGSLFLTVELLPSPPTSWQPASAELQIGTSNLLPAASKKSFPSDQEIIIQAKKRQRSISKNLVETSGGDFLYSDRNDSFKVLADCVEMRHGYQKQGKAERNLHPIPFLADGPGYGKSRFLQELPSSFIKFVQEGAYSQNFKDVFKTPVCTNISFSNGTAYSINEASQISIEQSVCLRILYQFETEYSNFGCFYFSNKSQQFNLSNILQIIGTDASCIILGIDEVNNVYEIGVEKQKKLNDPKERLLSGLFELIGRLSCGFSPLFIPVLAGTAIGPIKSAARESTHPPLHIPLPLLSFESCLNIFAKKNTKFSQLVQTSYQLRQLISDCGGHGRSLEILYNSSLKAYAEDVSLINWKIVIDEVRLVLHQRYEISTVPLTTAIARSFLSLDTDELDRYGEMKDTTYQDLEERGLIKLQNGKVKISHFFVCCFLYKSKYKTDLTMFWRELLVEKDFWWQGWEVFNRNYITFRLSLFAYLGKTTVSLKELFAGAKMNIPVDIDIKIPPLETLKVSKIDFRYPSTKAPAFDIGDNILNADGAFFDSFLYLDTTSNPLLLAFRMKFSKLDSTNQQVIRNDTVDEEFNKISSTVSKDLAGTDFVAVILSRRGGSFSESYLPSKCIVVSKEQQMDFYGASYYQRINNNI